MTAVRAVWCWKYSVSVFKATYGRVAGGSTYSKDYLQASGECAVSLERMLAKDVNTQETDVQFVWPGAVRAGKLFRAADYAANGRMNLRWPKDDAPTPWRLVDAPSASTAEVLPGTPSRRATEGEADAEWERLNARGLDPFVFVVLLNDGTSDLHVRMYLASPSLGLEHAALANLPQSLQALASKTTSGCSFWSQEIPVVRNQKLVEKVFAALEDGPNVLLAGPPGTGKTVALEDLRELFEHGGPKVHFDPISQHDPWSIQLVAPEGLVRSVVLHPSYSYEDLVIGLVPRPNISGTGVGVEVQAGPLLGLAHFALQTDQAALLIMDEFNRGNAAAVFGDTLALLDGDKRADSTDSGAVIDRAYPLLPVQLAADYSVDPAGDSLPAQIRLPRSLSIVAALNSSDRSVAPLDAALRRRFSILYVGPDYDSLQAHYVVADSPLPGDVAAYTRDDVLRLSVEVLQALNGRIEFVSGRDFLLGHALLWGVSGATRQEVVRSLAAAIQTRVLATLRFTYADQEEVLAAVLKLGPSDATGGPTGIAASWVQPPAAVSNLAVPRLRFVDLQQLTELEILAGLKDLL